MRILAGKFSDGNKWPRWVGHGASLLVKEQLQLPGWMWIVPVTTDRTILIQDEVEW